MRTTLERLKQFRLSNVDEFLIVHRDDFKQLMIDIEALDPTLKFKGGRMRLTDPELFDSIFYKPSATEVAIFFEADGMTFRRGSYDPTRKPVKYNEL